MYCTIEVNEFVADKYQVGMLKVGGSLYICFTESRYYVTSDVTPACVPL